MITKEEFYSNTSGKLYDIDGVPVGDPYQCADYFKKACQDVLGYTWPAGGDGYVDNFWYNRQAHASEFEFVQYPNYENGDFVIWAHSSRSNKTPFQLSHIAMYWDRKMVGQNQYGHKEVTECYVTEDTWRNSLGAFRFKAWEGDIHMKIGSGMTIRSRYENADILIYGMHDEDEISLVSAKNGAGEVTGNDLQLIGDIDDDEHIYYSKMNANFFINNPQRTDHGTALGVRCGLNEWSVPRQGAFYYYALKKDGTTEVGMDTEFNYAHGSEIQFACSPALILMKDGEDCEYISPETTWKRTQSNTQSLLIRTDERFAFAIVMGKLTPDQCVAWAKRIEGIKDICFMDSGGSSCLQIGYDVTYATSEHREISNALAFYKNIADKPTEPTDETQPTTEPITPTPVPEEPISEGDISPTFKINWAQKLSSRKFWVALSGLVISVLLLFGVDRTETELIGGVVMAVGTVVAYILAEGWVDVTRGKGS